MMIKKTGVLLWILRSITSLILLQTLYFKFTAHSESVQLFTQLGVEPWGRITLGCLELVIGIALMIPKVSLHASIGAAVILLGAIGTHVFVIGIEVNGDNGQLFLMAIFAFIAATGIFLIESNHSKN